MAVNIRVNVHPVVLFQIADAYERRAIDNHRVIGTLVGKYNFHAVSLTKDRVYRNFIGKSTE